MTRTPNPGSRGGIITHVCKICKKPFRAKRYRFAQVTSPEWVTCSPSCGVKAREILKGHKGKQKYVCACGCGAVIERYQSQVVGPVFHSREVAARTAHQRGSKPGRKPGPTLAANVKPKRPVPAKWAGMEKALKMRIK